MHWRIFSVLLNRAGGLSLVSLFSGHVSAQTLTVPPNITPPPPGSTFTKVTILSGGNLTADGLIITPGGGQTGIFGDVPSPPSATGVFTNTTIILGNGNTGIEANGGVTITMGAGSLVTSSAGSTTGVKVINGATVNFVDGASIRMAGNTSSAAWVSSGALFKASNSNLLVTGPGSTGLHFGDAGDIVLFGNGGTALMNGGSIVTTGANSVAIDAVSEVLATINGTFNGTEVNSVNGSGIFAIGHVNANLHFSNGASVIGGNGTLLYNQTTIAISVVNITGDDNVTFIGDVDALDCEGTTNFKLSGNSSLTGAINVNELTGAKGIEPAQPVIGLPLMNVNVDVDSTSVWNMRTSSTINTLNVAPGARIVFPASRTLAMNRLTGTGGIFRMEVDLEEVTGDLIHIQTSSEGKHSLALANISPASELPENSALLVVRTPDGASSYSGKVDGGVFRYTVVRGDGSSLIPNPHDWYLVPLGSSDDPNGPLPLAERLTPPANDSIGTFAATFPTFHADLYLIEERLAGLRMSRRELPPAPKSDFKESKEIKDVKTTPLPSTGIWVRGFGSGVEIDTRQSREFNQLMGGGEIGVDKRFDLYGGDLYVGAFAGYLRATRDFHDGSDGTADGLNVGLYGEWHHPSGWFVDVVLKHMYLWNDFSAPTSQSIVDADYTVPTFGGMLTIGKRWDIGNAFIEPYASLGGGWANSVEYEMSNGLKVHAGEQTSLRARLGFRAGFHCECANGQVLEPYARVGVMNEFLGDDEITMNGFDFHPRLGGAVVEASAGVSATLNKTLSVYAEYSYANGDKIRTPWAGNLGLRWEW